MKIIKHKFLSHVINPATETLIVGTFNPDAKKNPAKFFYGRSRNFLWRLLAIAFGEEDLTNKSVNEKSEFIKKRKIDFIDLISEVKVDEEINYDDSYIDNKVSEWRDIIGEIRKLKSIKRVCFTRKSFADIPHMKKRIEEIQKFCIDNNIDFQYLITPSRFYNLDKQSVWSQFLIKE
jgi:G:T/U-mismatch repair DNA glycosylase